MFSPAARKNDESRTRVFGSCAVGRGPFESFKNNHAKSASKILRAAFRSAALAEAYWPGTRSISTRRYSRGATEQNPTGKPVGSRVVWEPPAPSQRGPYPYADKARLGFPSHVGPCPLPLGHVFWLLSSVCPTTTKVAAEVGTSTLRGHCVRTN